MEEDEYNDIVTYIQDQKYPQNANESVKKVPDSLYCSFLIAPSVFSNVYFFYNIFPVEKL
jgi:hypothetical protein